MNEAAVWDDAVRAAALLAVDPGLGGAVVRAGPGPVREAWLALLRARLPDETPWRRLPPGIDDGRLLGGLDLAAALSGRRALQRGLLAEADGGVVVIPMAERLQPGAAARLTAALDDGVVRVEREGLAADLPARITVIALDEGAAPEERCPDSLADRLAFRLDLDAISPRAATSPAPTDVSAARARLASAPPPTDKAVHAICAAAAALGVESLRPSMLALRVARAAAALDGRADLSADDLTLAARLVLAPRATRMPDLSEPDTESPPPNPPPPSEAEGREGDVSGAALDDLVVAAALSAVPEAVSALWEAGGGQPGAGATPIRRRPTPTARGRRLGARPGLPRTASDLDLAETLKAAAPWQRLRGRAPGDPLRIRRDDLRLRRRSPRAESAAIFVVDASGSAALHRLAEAKGAVELMLSEAYVRRTQVALIAFRGDSAELLLPPTRAPARARRALAELAGGGATPLAAALQAAETLALAERARGRNPFLVILTDGRGNIALDGAAFRTRAETDTLSVARRIRASALPAAVVDTAPRPRGDGQRLAEAMGATFAPLPYVDAQRLRDVARALDAG